MNGVYIRELGADEFVARALPWLERAGLATAEDVASRPAWFRALTPLISERVKRLDEVAATVRFFFEEPTIDEGAREKVLNKDGADIALEVAADVLATCDWTAVDIEAAMRSVPETAGVKPKIAFQAVRVAVSGTTVSPPLFESLELLGRDTVLARIAAAQEG